MLTKHCYNCQHYNFIPPNKKAKQVEFCNLLGRSVLISLAINDEIITVPAHTAQTLMAQGAIQYDSEARNCQHYVNKVCTY